jgi:hypothetical protein
MIGQDSASPAIVTKRVSPAPRSAAEMTRLID